MAEEIFGFNPSTTVQQQQSITAKAEQPFDFLGVASTAAQALDPLAKQKNAADKLVGYEEAIEYRNSLEGMSETDKVADISNKIKDISSGDFSDGYRSGALSVMSPMFDRANQGMIGEQKEASFDVVAKGVIPTLQDGKSIEEYRAETKEANPVLTDTEINQSIVTGVYDYHIDLLNSKMPIEQVQASFTEATKGLNNSYYLNSKSKAMQSVINKKKSEYENLLRGKMAGIKETDTKNAWAIIHSAEGNLASPSLTDNYTSPWGPIMEESYATIYPNNPDAIDNARTKYIKGYEKAEKARKLEAEMPLESGPNSQQLLTIMGDSDIKKTYSNKYAMKITEGLLANSPDVVNIYGNAAGHQLLEEAKVGVQNILYSTDDVNQLEGYLNTLASVNNKPNGPATINNIVGTKEYLELRGWALISKIDNVDLTQARDAAEKYKQQPLDKTKDVQKVMRKAERTPFYTDIKQYLSATKGNPLAAKIALDYLEDHTETINGIEVLTFDSALSPKIEKNKDIYFENMATDLEAMGYDNEDMYYFRTEPDGSIMAYDSELNLPLMQRTGDMLFQQDLANRIKLAKADKALSQQGAGFLAERINDLTADTFDRSVSGIGEWVDNLINTDEAKEMRLKAKKDVFNFIDKVTGTEPGTAWWWKGTKRENK